MPDLTEGARCSVCGFEIDFDPRFDAAHEAAARDTHDDYDTAHGLWWEAMS